MIRIDGTITYLDGREEEYHATQREVAAWERYALRSGLPTGIGTPLASMVTMTRYLAWAASTRGAEEPVSFEVWDADVAEVSAPEEGVQPVDPTQADQPADSWPP